MTEKQDISIKKWEYFIKDYQESGMTLREWCAANEVSKYQYYYWLKKVRAEHYEMTVKQLKAAESLNSTISEEAGTGSFVELSPETIDRTAKQINQSQPISSLAITNVPVAVLKKGSFRIEIMPHASASFILQLLKAVDHA